MKRLTPLWVVASAVATGCASYPPCMLVGACASHTTSAKTLREAAQPLTTLCVSKLTRGSSLPLRIMAVAPSITPAHQSAARDNASRAIKVYADEAPGAIAETLASSGVSASVCPSTVPPDMPRLYLQLRGVTTDTGGLGWNTQADISAALALSASGSSTVWSGSFMTGNRTAVGAGPDKENVLAFAENVVGELARSGWIKAR